MLNFAFYTNHVVSAKKEERKDSVDTDSVTLQICTSLFFVEENFVDSPPFSSQLTNLI